MTDLELAGRVKNGDPEAIEEFHKRYYTGASKYARAKTGLPLDEARSLANWAIFKAIKKINAFEGKASKGTEGVEEGEGSLKWWVLKIVKNEAVDIHRKKFSVRTLPLKSKRAQKNEVSNRSRRKMLPGHPILEEKPSASEKVKTPRDALDDPHIKSYDDASFNEPVASTGKEPGGPEYGDEPKLTKKQLWAKKALDSLTPSQRSILLMRMEKSDEEIAQQEFVKESTIRSRYNRAKNALEKAYDEASEEEE